MTDELQPWQQDFEIFAELFKEMNDSDRRIVVEFSRLIAAQARRQRRALRRPQRPILPN